jgi:hypothetical protein
VYLQLIELRSPAVFAVLVYGYATLWFTTPFFALSAWIERKHQLDAVDRWFTHGWRRLDHRLRSSITEGIVVFLSLLFASRIRLVCAPVH